MMHLLALLLMPQTTSPPAARVAGPDDIQVTCTTDEANNYPGKIVGIEWVEGAHIALQNVTEPAGVVIVGAGGREAQGVSFSPHSSATYVYDLTITSVVNSSHTVSCESQPEAVYYSDPAPDGDSPGRSYFKDCFFGGPPVLNYRVSTPHEDIGTLRWLEAYDCFATDIPGLWIDTAGQAYTACKWWVQPKAPRFWEFDGCIFAASQEHGVYTHWAHGLRVENCIFYACGGTNIQDVFRYGRPDTDRYHGNPSMSPPMNRSIVVRRTLFDDADIWGREGSDATFVGPGDIWLEQLRFHGARGAIAIWSDSFKGQYSYTEDGIAFAHIIGVDEFGDNDIQVGPGGEITIIEDDSELQGYPFGVVTMDDITVLSSPNHSREQIMVTGARVLHLKDIQVDSHKPKLVVGAQGGGAWKYHPLQISFTGEIPDPKYWDGDRYQTGMAPSWTQIRPHTGTRNKTRRGSRR
jgi:hypothetical protein